MSMPHPNFFDFWEFSEILYYGTDLEILQNSARALCLAFFLGRKKTVFLHFFPSNLGTPAHSCKVFATRPPERIGFGNNAKRCMGTMFGIFCRWEKKTRIFIFSVKFSLPLGTPAASRTVFATPPPQSTRLGNQSDIGVWAPTIDIFFRLVKLTCPPNCTLNHFASRHFVAGVSGTFTSEQRRCHQSQ